MARALRPPPPVGEVLRNLRVSRNLTQEELGRRAGLSMTYISLVENGRRNPTIVAVSALLTVLRISWTEFGVELDAATR